jgi:iron complex outermembrane receptor protein
MRSILLWGLLVTWTMRSVQTHADRLQNTPAIDLTALTLEDLMNIEVTLASRKGEKLFKTAAAISVLTRDDLRRSGATSIAEALRLVPGMQVGRIDANKWAIGARGFNFRFSNKLLVLVDGRSVYTPLFSGVFWEIQDLVLEDIERIEVIRGPGATLWGANAVNGIINIVTANAAATQGGLLKASSGSEERGLASLRYGGSLAAETTYRVYAKFIARDDFADASGTSTADAWDMRRAGFRIDWEPTARDALSWQGSLYNGQTGQTYRIPTLIPPFLDTFDDDTDWLGGHLQTHWRRTWSQEAAFDLQLYYNRERSSDRTLTQEHDTYDLDLQHRFTWGARHDMVWGLGYRFTTDDTEGSFKISFDPGSRNAHLFSAFAQDQINLGGVNI